MGLLILDYCILQVTTSLDPQMQIGVEIMMIDNQHLDLLL